MINLLFAGNFGVYDGILTALLSVLKRTKTKEPFRVFILTMNLTNVKDTYISISNAQTAFLDEVVKSYNPDSEVVRVDVSKLYEEEFSGCPNEDCYCSPYTLLRLFADEIEGIPDKILYLDADIMFNRDITELYRIDTGDAEYAAARDQYGKFLVRPDYINAGVLLFNMKRARETGLFEKARELIRTKKLPFADQSAIIRSTTKRMMLPQKFNDQRHLRASTVVRHFAKKLFYFPYPHADNVKPWQVDRVHKIFRYHAFDDIFEEYARLKAGVKADSEPEKECAER